MIWPIIMHNVKIYLENSPSDADNQFTIRINQCIINCYTLGTDKIEFDCEFVAGWNSLQIELIKYSTDYCSVKVDEIFIDDSAMKYMLNDFGQVIPDWNQDPGLKEWYIQNQGQAPDCFPKRRTLDMPGMYEFKFRTPLREYIEDFYQLPDPYKKHYNQSLERYLILEERLNCG